MEVVAEAQLRREVLISLKEKKDQVDLKKRYKNKKRYDEVRCFNVEISQAGKEQKLKEAVQVFIKMLKLRLKPTIISYTALLNAYVREGEAVKTVGIFNSILASTTRTANSIRSVPKTQGHPTCDI